MGSGPLVIAYDGSDSSERALREAASVLSARRALVVCVWEPGMVGLGPVDTTGIGIGAMPYPVDFEVAAHLDEAMAEKARRTAQHGARIAGEVGLDAQALAIADDAASVAETLLRVARERDAAAIVIGSHGHGRLTELLGSTSRELLRHASGSVLIVCMKDDGE